MNVPLSIQNVSSLPRYFWHPSVVYIEGGISGHKWWMAQSPYHPGVELQPYRARWELPCIHYSDDGIHWKAVQTNPIDDLSEQQIHDEDYLSDPHLLYKDGVLELYYRLTLLCDKQIVGNKTILYKKTSTNGVNWSERIIVADLRRSEDVEIWGEQIISQAIVWTGKEYICWYVDASGYKKDRGIKVATSKDGICWENAQQCLIEDYLESPWHIDVQKIDGIFHMLCYGDNGCLAHLISDNGRKWQFQNTILSPSHLPWSFYYYKIYRSCVTIVGDIAYIYFSAATRERSYIGLMQTSDWKKFVHVGPLVNWQYIKDLVHHTMKKVVRTIKKARHLI